jgi:hypothetical protein
MSTERLSKSGVLLTVNINTNNYMRQRLTLLSCTPAIYFCFYCRLQTSSGAHPASYPMGTGGPFPGVKRGRGVTLTTHPHLVPTSRITSSYISSPLCRLQGGRGTVLLLMSMGRRVRIAATTDLLFNPQVICERGEPWYWLCRLGKTPVSPTRVLWQSYQHRNLGTSTRNVRRSENFACCKFLRHGTFTFISHPKGGVLRIFIVLKNPSPRPGLNPRPLGLVVSTLTTTPPR